MRSKYCYTVRTYDLRDAENVDGITECRHKNGIYYITWNVTEYANLDE